MDSRYFAEDYVAGGYVVYTADAASDLTAYTSVDGTQAVYVALGYTDPGYFLVPVVGDIVARPPTQALASLVTTASVSVAGGAARSAASAITCAVTLSASANKIFSGTASASSAASLSGSGQRTRDAGYATPVYTWDDQSTSWDDWIGLYWDPIPGTTLSSNTVFSCTGANTRSDGSANLVVSGTVSAQGNYVRIASAVLTTVTTVQAQPDDRTRSVQLALASTATFTAVPDNRTKSASAALSSAGGFVLSVQATRNFVAALSSAFSVAVAADDRTRSALAGLLTAASVLAVSRQFKGGSADIVSQCSVDTTALKLKLALANLDCVATIATSATKFRQASATISCAATFAAIAKRIQPGASALVGQTTVAAQAYRIKPGAAAIVGVFTMVTVARIPGIQIMDAQTFTANFAVASVISRNLVGASNFTAVASQTSTARVTTDIVKSIQAQASVTGIPGRRRPGSSTINSNFSVATNNIRIRPGAGTLTSRMTISALGGYIVTGQTIPFQAVVTVSAQGVKDSSARATLRAAGFVVSVGDVFTLDPDFQIRVVQESRLYPILSELRLLSVTEETRVNSILPELRSTTVAPETRVLEVL